MLDKRSYVPLAAEGTFQNCVVAFARPFEDRCVIAAVPRFVSAIASEGTFPLGATWKDTRLVLPDELPKTWTETLSGGDVDGRPNLLVAELFRHFPCALLEVRA